jgi:hypothetical protein
MVRLPLRQTGYPQRDKFLMEEMGVLPELNEWGYRILAPARSRKGRR